MIALQDHLLSVLVGGVVLLILGGVYLTTQRTNVDTMGAYGAKVRSFAFQDVLERDLENIGVAGPGQPAVLAYEWGTARRFEFVTMGDTTATAPPIQVQYRVVASQSPVCQRANLSCYAVERYVYNGTTYVLAMRSPDTLVRFDLTLGPAGATLDTVREVRVQMEQVAESLDDGVRRVRWVGAFQPPNLALRTASPNG